MTVAVFLRSRRTRPGSRGTPLRPFSKVRPEVTRRLDVARAAEDLSRDVQYAETRTKSGEAAFGIGKVSAKWGASLGLTSLPSTEADLISRLERFVSRLEGAGYRVVVGIDELDKP